MTPTDQWHTRNVVWSDQQTCVGLILPINAPNEIRTSARFAGKLLYAPPCKATCAPSGIPAGFSMIYLGFLPAHRRTNTSTPLGRSLESLPFSIATWPLSRGADPERHAGCWAAPEDGRNGEVAVQDRVEVHLIK